MEEEMQASLSKFSDAATIDPDTPRDGSCLFHALKSGGLFAQRELGDVCLSVADLRKMAVNEATEEQLALAAATNDPPMSTAEYKRGMRNGDWGDNLMLACLSRAFKKPISVISKDTARTFLPDGEVPGVLEEAVWVAHYAELHYFGVRRVGREPRSDAEPRKRVIGKQGGAAFDVRLRQDRIGKTRMSRMAQRLADCHIFRKGGKKRQHGGKRSEDEDLDDEQAGQHEKDAPEMPEWKNVPYTRESQCSPGRDARGRRPHPGTRGKKSRGQGLWSLLVGKVSETRLFEWCVKAGFLTDRRQGGGCCPKCGLQTEWTLDSGRQGSGCSYV